MRKFLCKYIFRLPWLVLWLRSKYVFGACLWFLNHFGRQFMLEDCYQLILHEIIQQKLWKLTGNACRNQIIHGTSVRKWSETTDIGRTQALLLYASLQSISEPIIWWESWNSIVYMLITHKPLKITRKSNKNHNFHVFLHNFLLLFSAAQPMHILPSSCVIRIANFLWPDHVLLCLEINSLW